LDPAPLKLLGKDLNVSLIAIIVEIGWHEGS